uniref:Uncharacterized protein n=1 Tax=Pyxicephalus adspersus TaxID=30357 RepID=A0AAV3AM13_PYXAD|nr:TPA: hypothetical protein GDO54_000253 [Pyxicephalus adspersus]
MLVFIYSKIRRQPYALKSSISSQICFFCSLSHRLLHEDPEVRLAFYPQCLAFYVCQIHQHPMYSPCLFSASL